jgi:hypothetical protein
LNFSCFSVLKCHREYQDHEIIPLSHVSRIHLQHRPHFLRRSRSGQSGDHGRPLTLAPIAEAVRDSVRTIIPASRDKPRVTAPGLIRKTIPERAEAPRDAIQPTTVLLTVVRIRIQTQLAAAKVSPIPAIKGQERTHPLKIARVLKPIRHLKRA